MHLSEGTEKLVGVVKSSYYAAVHREAHSLIKNSLIQGHTHMHIRIGHQELEVPAADLDCQREKLRRTRAEMTVGSYLEKLKTVQPHGFQ